MEGFWLSNVLDGGRKPPSGLEVHSHGLSSVEREKGEVNNSFQLAGKRALLPGD
jgi:hypothetical protein